MTPEQIIIAIGVAYCVVATAIICWMIWRAITMPSVLFRTPKEYTIADVEKAMEEEMLGDWPPRTPEQEEAYQQHLQGEMAAGIIHEPGTNGVFDEDEHNVHGVYYPGSRTRF